MMFVVDTSVAVKWFVAEADTPLAERLLVPGCELAAPDLIVAELGNVLWRKQRLGEVDSEQVDHALEHLPGFFRHLAPSADLIRPAVDMARQLGHSVYDCIYLAQATGHENARLVTADARFIAKVASTRFAQLLQPLDGLQVPKDR